MSEATFNRAEMEALIAQADSDGVFAKAQGDWQPDADTLVCVLADLGEDVRADKDTKKKFAVMKPSLLIVEGVDARGNNLADKSFPLDRYGFSTTNDMSMRAMGKSASVLAGEPVTTFAAARLAFGQAFSAQTVFTVQRTTGLIKGGANKGKTWTNFAIVGIVNTGEAAPAAAPADQLPA
jgi:hypothetical protein